ncbi:MAG: biotin/lipoyl-binding protein [Candidatus Melainabacteria bacterium]|nr:biotin/lipoyl-binding protein [Candidatus Melainabacteria bacterium]
MSNILTHSKAFQVLGSPQLIRFLALWSILLLLLAMVALIFVPWQQTVVGIGKVTVFSPMQRPQPIQAQLSGGLKRWHVVEGQRVEEGQLLAELEDLDPKYMAANQPEALIAQRQAIQSRRSAALARIDALEEQYRALTQSRQAAIPGAGQRISQNQQRIVAAQQAVTAAEEALHTAQLNHQRLTHLYEKGLRSRRDYELAELDRVRAETGLKQAQAQLSVAFRDKTVSSFDQSKVIGDTASALATVSAAIASARETVASADNDLAKLSIEQQSIAQRVAFRQVKSPVSGRVVRLLPVGKGQTVTEGEVLATVVPDNHDPAVALYVSDWDAPLVTEGRPVRLQFSGWPAIQFSGWPAIATGTFGGRVMVVDAVDDGMGRYRVLVRPDYDLIRSGKDEPWPSSQYLRPGSGASGWILLETVPLGYELWRQFNGFPPRLKQSPTGNGEASYNGDAGGSGNGAATDSGSYDGERSYKRKPKKP